MGRQVGKKNFKGKKTKPGFSKRTPVNKEAPKSNNKPLAKKSDGDRLNKYIANAGVCSRREADKYIEAGLVSVNGKIVTELGTKVYFGDKVKVNEATIAPEKKTYILLNKPKDYVVPEDDKPVTKNVLDLVSKGCKERVYPVGKLDKTTTGLLLLTNDGELATFLAHPKNNKKKIYQITLDKEPKNEDLEKLLVGISLDDGLVKATEVNFCNPDDKKEIGIEIQSGKHRVVRTMFESIGFKVRKLDRVYFAGLTKKNLPRGKWRFLSDKEIVMLKRGIYK